MFSSWPTSGWRLFVGKISRLRLHVGRVSQEWRDEGLRGEELDVLGGGERRRKGSGGKAVAPRPKAAGGKGRGSDS